LTDVAVVHAIGLMSGTSLEGVDAAIIATDGEHIAGFEPSFYRLYTDVRGGVVARP